MATRIESLERRRSVPPGLLSGMVDGLLMALVLSLLAYWKMDDPGADRVFRPDSMSLARLVGVGVVAAIGGALHGVLRSRTNSGFRRILLGAGVGLGAGALFVFPFLTPEAIWERGAFGMLLAGPIVGAYLAARLEWRRRDADE